MRTLYVDGEMLPPIGMTDEEREAYIRSLPAGTCTKAESKEAWWLAAIKAMHGGTKHKGKDDPWRRAVFNPLLCRALIIAWAIDDGPVQSLQADYTGCVGDMAACDAAEGELLMQWHARLWDIVRTDSPGKATWVSWNGDEYDWPVLRLRALKYRQGNLARALPHDRWCKDSDDAQRIAMGTRRQSGGFSLDAVARFLGVGSKTEGMDGSKVYQMWLDGRHEENAAYCENDVEILRGAYWRLQGE